ncbi:aldo/keto reductase [Actinoplanes sp. TBRC 11911]|uniref:aldo/keto reductase n=1 Tax=Actinoplanes sp. TBRC 11911 TaxID=2729386 RepID=UPI00145F0943|nr:aldo/keto reductase [Actinoplanes sp. TBRC 11911]NMO57544.1 aldo/keto reductase [Actinoplanes sp. TBRC 11911]
MSEQLTRTLTTGVDIPYLGFGTYLIPNAGTADAVEAAIIAGYRHIDTAEDYANERGVGEGMRRGLAATGLDRSDVFVTTKLWPGNPGEFKSTAETLQAFDESLDKLGLDYVDLYLIHAPFEPAQRLGQWRALVELHENKKARAIGVSNFNAAHIQELVTAGLPQPHANQIELHPWSQKPDIVAYLNDNDITPIAYSSLAPLSTWRIAPGHASGKTDAQRAEGRSDDFPFKTMAAKYGVTEAQLLLRWGIENGYPVLPKSTNPARMRENADVFSFAIDGDDLAAIKFMDRGNGLAWGTQDPTHAA